MFLIILARDYIEKFFNCFSIFSNSSMPRFSFHKNDMYESLKIISSIEPGKLDILFSISSKLSSNFSFIGSYKVREDSLKT